MGGGRTCVTFTRLTSVETFANPLHFQHIPSASAGAIPTGLLGKFIALRRLDLSDNYLTGE